MNRRLRKKLHRNEYQVFGFHIEFITKSVPPWEDGSGKFEGPGVQFSERLDAWAHTEHQCCFAPGGDGKRRGAFVSPDRVNMPYPGITLAKRDQILVHLQSLPEVEKYVVSPLHDVYGDDEELWKQFCQEADEQLGKR